MKSSADSRQMQKTSQVVVALALSLAWVLVWYWPTAREMASIWWRSDTYAHGLVVLPISAWLVWRARTRFTGLQFQPEWRMTVPILAGGVLWLLGGLASVAAAQHFALIVMLVGLIIGVLGWPLTRVLLFPLLFLFFAVPIGDFMVPTLMHYTAEFTVWALRLSGVPVYQEGLHFVVPNGRWSVIEACSGSRYLVASLMVGALYAYLNYHSLRRRLWFMLAAAVVPIIANWLRAYMIVMLGYLSDNTLAVGVDHLLYGWVFFGIVIFLLFWVGGRWQEEDPVPETVRSDEADRGGAAGRMTVVALLALTFLPFPAILRVLDRPVASFPVSLQLPAPTVGWQEGDEQLIDYRPRYAGARATAYRSYLSDEQPPVGLYVAWYYGQREGSEMLSWGNGPEADKEAGISLLGQSRYSSRGLMLNEARLLTPQGNLLVWYVYRSDGVNRYRESEMKLRLALERLLGREDESAAIVVMTPVGETPAAARQRLEGFLGDYLPAIGQSVDEAARSIPQ